MVNFYERIAGAARSFPDRVAIEWIGNAAAESATYTTLLAEAERVSAWLAAAGIDRGDRVALLAANDIRWVAVYLGVLHRGAIAVPLDTAYGASQVAAILTDSGARLIVAGDRQIDVARQAAATLSTSPRVATTAEPGAGEALGMSSPASGIEPDAAAVILYTSGTTADPKGVVLTHANLDGEREAVLAVVRASHEDVVLGVLPLFHALAEMANLWLPLCIGARVVFLETVNSTSLLDALEKRGVTILACVPQFFYLIHQRVVGEIARKGAIARAAFRALLSVNTWMRDHLGVNPGRRVFARVHHALGPRMRLLITGGSRFDPSIARDLYGLGVGLYNGYGLTETSGAATIVRAGDRFNTSVGQPLPGVEVRIAPPAGADDGEILIRGPIVMREYYRRPDATAAVLDDGWLRTGDLGRIDGDGRVYITGRLKEVIVLSSGKNLYPEEIEAHYRQSLFIKELCVMGLGRPGEPAAERLHAVVVPDDGALRDKGIVNVRELIRFELEGLSVRLPPHKRILTFEIAREPLARTSTGKLRRSEIARAAQSRAAAPQEARTLTDDERAWLAVGDRAATITFIAERVTGAAVHPDANLELDLGLDSMERVELLSRLETRRGVRVTPETRATIFTIRQLVDAVDAAGPAASALQADADLPWDALLAEAPDPVLQHELGRSKLLRARFFHLASRTVLFLLKPFLSVRVTGAEHVPTTRPFIVAPNHQTFLDGFLVGAALPFRAFRHIYFVGAAEFFETPFMAWGARAINIVPLDPDANLVNAMQAAATGLRLGKVLMLFPEGERTIDGTLKPFRKGAAILASHLGAPIVPVALDGVFPIWPRGRPFQWRALFSWRRRVTIAFAPPMTITRGNYSGGTETLRNEVQRMLKAQ